MALPKIKHPTYNETIPSNKVKIRFRPFTAKEEKLILMANQSDSLEDAVDAIKQILQNCVVKPADFDVDQLTTFDIEYLFIKIRAKSVGETVEVRLQEDGKTYVAEINLEDIKIEFNPENNNVIMLDDSVGISMKYPTFDQLSALDQQQTEENEFGIIADCVDCVFDGDKVYDSKNDFTKEELVKFLEELELKPLQQIGKFFATIPALTHTATFKANDGDTKEITLKGIRDFFM